MRRLFSLNAPTAVLDVMKSHKSKKYFQYAPNRANRFPLLPALNKCQHKLMLVLKITPFKEAYDVLH
ncbi:hypothetical protein [Undibacterium sp. TJN19]|uniref:hypothetical protein n=1 Tax=Undibacterium sp. TJN19 TaxID=3413055 RepID=UPI003BF2FB30